MVKEEGWEGGRETQSRGKGRGGEVAYAYA